MKEYAKWMAKVHKQNYERNMFISELLTQNSELLLDTDCCYIIGNGTATYYDLTQEDIIFKLCDALGVAVTKV